VSLQMKQIVRLDADKVRECWALVASLLNKSNERDFIIVATAYLESLALDAFTSLLPGINIQGFNAQLKILTVRGLLAPEAKDLLADIWELRCKFAHRPTDFSLTDASAARVMTKLHRKGDALVFEHLEEFEKKIRAQLGGSAGGATLDFAGNSEMRFLTFVVLQMCINLFAAKALCPEALPPPKLDEMILSWGK
jgi:hypothetical protein